MDNTVEIEALNAEAAALHARLTVIYSRRRELGWRSKEEIAAERKAQKKADRDRRYQERMAAYRASPAYAEDQRLSAELEDRNRRGKELFDKLGPIDGPLVMDTFRKHGIDAAWQEIHRIRDERLAKLNQTTS